MSGTEIYDSRRDTAAHMLRVTEFIETCIMNLVRRAQLHDQSKLQSPEKEIFDEMTPKLKTSTYGSEEYKAMLAGMKPALDHHYANNSHHPEHYSPLECILCFTPRPKDPLACCQKCGNSEFGTPAPSLKGMSLLDILEMLCDWKAAGERHANGSIESSLKVNRVRFGISDQLFVVIENTARELGWLKSEAICGQ